MNLPLKMLFGKKVAVCHVDDILVFSDTTEEHHETLRTVFKKLEAEGRTINREKYLGHIVLEHEIYIDPDRLKAVVAFAEPTNKVEFQRFLGMVHFAARFFMKILNQFIVR